MKEFQYLVDIVRGVYVSVRVVKPPSANEVDFLIRRQVWVENHLLSHRHQMVFQHHVAEQDLVVMARQSFIFSAPDVGMEEKFRDKSPAHPADAVTGQI